MRDGAILSLIAELYATAQAATERAERAEAELARMREAEDVDVP